MVTITISEGIVWNLVAKAMEHLGKAAIKNAASLSGVRGELEEVEETIRVIQARVRDAEGRQEELSSELIKRWLRRLKQVLYWVDDLCDEVLTRDCQKQQKMERGILGKVGALFSMYDPLYYNKELADEIKSIRIELDALKSEMDSLNLSDFCAEEEGHSKNRLMEKREITSFVNVEDVIGRENDVNMIIEMLFDPEYDGEKVTVISIVGFGGLGKTTLAQLIFSDERVKKHFDLTRWAYVSEKDNEIVITGKIFNSFTGKNYHNYQLEDIQEGIKESIATNKYLLVLDDLWYEGDDRLDDLVNLLKCGKQGSKVIVTTRSNVAAKGIGAIEVPHKIRTLTDGQSWSLFKRLAYKPGQEDNTHDLIMIGKQIIKMCGNVPLVIKVVGGSLRSKDTKEEWLQVQETQCSKTQLITNGDDVMVVLKMNYDYLSPALKRCFTYCSLFPKGSWLEKNELVQLWMAQGYLEPSNEDTGDQYIAELLERNFLQNPEISDEGNVVRCKMHNLLHDLAQEVADNESVVLVDESPINISDELVHVSLNGSICPPSLLLAKKMRSLLCISNQAFPEVLISRFQSLRVLSMECITHMKLPDSVGRLIHLRYLKFGRNTIKILPDSITRLRNLQTLNLESCSLLEELPRDFANLSNLRHLLIDWRRLTDLPPGFGNMTSLQELKRFIVGKSNGIDSLPASNLKGVLNVTFRKWRRNAIEEMRRSNLKDNHHLNSLTLELDFEEEAATPIGEMNKMLTCLQFPPFLKCLEVHRFKGDEMPIRWLDGLSKLVSISITHCERCKALPHLSQLPYLKTLELSNLNDLEYTEDADNIPVGTGAHSAYFPSLQVLKLDSLIQLKGWTRLAKDDSEQRQLVYPSLLELKVHNCPALMSDSVMPLAPKLESLQVYRINGKVFERNLISNIDEEAQSYSSAAPSSSISSTLFKSLKKLGIYLVNDNLDLLSISSSFCYLNEVSIVNCRELKSLRFVSPNSIRQLHIEGCHKLKSISEGLQNLSVLEKLGVYHCPELEMDNEEEEEEEGKSSWGWQGLTSLRQLGLWGLPNMKKLPRGIAHLTTLQRLSVGSMKNLTELPEEIGNLCLLYQLRLEDCPKIKSLPTATLSITTLDELWLCRMMNLTELPFPSETANVSLLNRLNIENCPVLKSLPTSLLGLTTLRGLYIKSCLLLAKRYRKPDGEDCHLVQHIPLVKIR